MNRQEHASAREIIVANSIRDVVSELRMVEVADYIAFIRMERFACISDIVDSAAELYFMPGTLRLGNGGEAQASWSLPPCIVLDLELHPGGCTVFFSLSMSSETAAIEVNYVAFEEPDEDPHINSARLEQALEKARIRAAAPLRMTG